MRRRQISNAGSAPSAGKFSSAASVTAAGITAVLDVARWDVVTCEEHTRTLANRDGRTVQLNDVVVRATSRG